MRKLVAVVTILIIAGILNAESLFQVKATNGKTVLDVTSDGLIVLNPNSIAPGVDDTLMIITNTQMKSFVSGTGGKGLAKSVSIVATSNLKGTKTNILEVTKDNTKMSEGINGDRYTNLSPDNTFLGHLAGANSTGTDNVFIGDSAGFANTGGTRNVFMGASAGAMSYSSSNNNFGNVFIGHKSGYHNQWLSNVFIGWWSGKENTTGGGNVFLGSFAGNENIDGSGNTYIGNSSGLKHKTGNCNTVLGGTALYNNTTGIGNTILGYSSGYNNVSGNYNVFLGYNTGNDETGSNKLYIDNSSTAFPLIWGDFANNRIVINGNSTNNPYGRNFFVYGSAGGSGNWNNTLKESGKSNIKTISSALDKITQLRGVKYQYQETDSSKAETQIGFVASEVEKVLPEVVEKSGDSYSIQYAPINAVLVEAVKEQQKQIDEIKKENLWLRQELEKIILKNK